jgi:hypothetical protein
VTHLSVEGSRVRLSEHSIQRDTKRTKPTDDHTVLACAFAERDNGMGGRHGEQDGMHAAVTDVRRS